VVSRAAKLALRQHIAVRGRAEDARESFKAYMHLAGRTEHGQKLITDAVFDRGCDLLQQAYREGRDFRNEEHRGARKTTRNIGWMAWCIGRDVNLSILYTTNREDEANLRGRWLQQLLTSEEHLRVFPNAGLLRTASNAANTTVRGKTNRGAPNVHVSGISGARAGPHYDMLILDDVCDQKSSIAYPAMKENIKATYRATVRPMLNDRMVACGRAGVGMQVNSGTVYAPDDLNAETAAAAKADPKRWLYFRTACGGPPDFVSPCPKILSSEALRQLYHEHARAYEMNYMLLPIADSERPFRRIWYYLLDPATAAQVRDIGYTPAVLPEEERWGAPNPQWMRVMAVDPGFAGKRHSSASGIVVSALGVGGYGYILYSSKARQPWDEVVDLIPEIYKRGKVSRLRIEEAGTQIAVLSHLRSKGIPYVEGASTGSASKEYRAQDIAGEVNQGRVLMPGRMYQGPDGRWHIVPANAATRELVDDALAFPGVAQKDLIDAFVYNVQALREMAAPREASAAPERSFVQERFAALRELCFGGQPEPPSNPEWEMWAGGRLLN